MTQCGDKPRNGTKRTPLWNHWDVTKMAARSTIDQVTSMTLLCSHFRVHRSCACPVDQRSSTRKGGVLWGYRCLIMHVKSG